MKCFVAFVYSAEVEGQEVEVKGSVILEGAPRDSEHLRRIEKVGIAMGLNKSNPDIKILSGPTIVSYSALPPEDQNGASPLVIPGRGKIQPARR